jgi:hypothetical protein
MQTDTPLWLDLNGRIACQTHLGLEATAILAERRSAKSITTSDTKWFKLSAKEIIELGDLVHAMHSSCKSCHDEVK